MATLYSVTHIQSGLVYIGWASKKVENRWAVHKSDAKHNNDNIYFHRALQKHGPDNFEWINMQYFDTDTEAKQSEIYWIAYLKNAGVSLYNRTDGGDGATGYKHLPGTKLDHNKGKIMSDDQKQKISLSLKDRIFSNDHKQKLSDAQTGSKNHQYGKRYSGTEVEAHARKLNWTKVRLIRELILQGLSNVDISTQFNVPHQTISKIRLNLQWKIEKDPLWVPREGFEPSLNWV